MVIAVLRQVGKVAIWNDLLIKLVGLMHIMNIFVVTTSMKKKLSKFSFSLGIYES